jgi:hypothetical protein
MNPVSHFLLSALKPAITRTLKLLSFSFLFLSSIYLLQHLYYHLTIPFLLPYPHHPICPPTILLLSKLNPPTKYYFEKSTFLSPLIKYHAHPPYLLKSITKLTQNIYSYVSKINLIICFLILNLTSLSHSKNKIG